MTMPWYPLPPVPLFAAPPYIKIRGRSRIKCDQGPERLPRRIRDRRFCPAGKWTRPRGRSPKVRGARWSVRNTPGHKQVGTPHGVAAAFSRSNRVRGASSETSRPLVRLLDRVPAVPARFDHGSQT